MENFDVANDENLNLKKKVLIGCHLKCHVTFIEKKVLSLN